MTSTSKLVAIVVAIGVVSTWSTAFVVHQRRHAEDRLLIERASENLSAELTHVITHYEVSLHAIRALVSTSENIDAKQFQTLVDSLTSIQLPGFESAGYAQRQQINDGPEVLEIRLQTIPKDDLEDQDNKVEIDRNQLAALYHMSGSLDYISQIDKAAGTLTLAMPVTRMSGEDTINGIVFIVAELEYFTGATVRQDLGVDYSIELRDNFQRPNRFVANSRGSHRNSLKQQLRETFSNEQLGLKWNISMDESSGRAQRDQLALSILVGGAVLTMLAAAALAILRIKADRAGKLAEKLNVDVHRLATIVERTTNAVVLTDSSRSICWVNDGFTRLTGYTFNEAIGQFPGKLLQFSKTDPATIRQLREGISSGKGFCGEIFNRSKYGREYWVYADIQPLRNDEGSVIGYLAIQSEITELKKATEGLAQAREQTECALDGGKLCIWRWDLENQVIHLDHRFFEIVQFELETTSPPAELILNRIHVDDLPRVNQVVLECTSGTLPYFEVEFRLLNDRGEYKWMLSRGRGSSRNSDGVVNQLIGTAVEITDRKNAEVALQESESKTSAVFNCSIDAIMIMNDLIIVDCNQPAVSIFGFSEKRELIGKHIGQLSPEFQANGKGSRQYADEISELIKQTGQARFEWTHLYCDGSKFEVDVSFSSLEISGRAAQLAIIRDISKKKELERQLSQAQKLESIGQLAAGIAHEVNTPMQCVYSNVEFLKASLAKIFSLTNAYREAIDTFELDTAGLARLLIAEKECRFDSLSTDCMDAVTESADASNRVIEIIRAMKTMSHPGTSQLSNTNLNKLIKDASLISKNRWKYAANFELDLDPSITEVAILPAQMSQVFLNLIVNAADAIVEKVGIDPVPENFGTIRASTRKSSGGIVIEISDTGVGMDERIKQRVFDPFFTTKEVGKGTGQGLAIVYDAVVRQHLGQISIDSTPGVGTTFRVWLPNTLNAPRPLQLASHEPSSLQPSLN